MKAIINCRTPDSTWAEYFFPTENPYLIPVLGKPIIEFYLDYCSLCGISDVLVAYDEYNYELSKFISNGSNWGLNITTFPNGKNLGKDYILNHNGSFAGVDVLYFDGFFFPFYDKNLEKVPADPNWKRIDVSSVKSPDVKFAPCKEVEFSTLREYFDFNISAIRNDTSKLIMKGYTPSQPNVFIGMNDVIMRTAKLSPAFIIGDNAQIEEGVKIGKDAIIGNTCIIDRRTIIDTSIVFDKTFVGPDLYLHNKILCGNKIIDPIGGIQVSFADNFFSTQLIEGTMHWITRRLVEIPFAILCMLMMSPYMLLFSMFIGTPACDYIRVPLMLGRRSIKSYPKYEKTRGWRNTWFFKLSLDKFVPLWSVLTGDVKLIGDTPWDIYKDIDVLSRYEKYEVGVFSYPDSLGHEDPYEILIDDVFYRYNRKRKTDLQLLLRSFVSRLLKGEKPADA